MASNPILKISKVSRTFGAIQALKEANFEINEGEIMGLVGENGAGKSTAMNVCGRKYFSYGRESQKVRYSKYISQNGPSLS